MFPRVQYRKQYPRPEIPEHLLPRVGRPNGLDADKDVVQVRALFFVVREGNAPAKDLVIAADRAFKPHMEIQICFSNREEVYDAIGGDEIYWKAGAGKNGIDAMAKENGLDVEAMVRVLSALGYIIEYPVKKIPGGSASGRKRLKLGENDGTEE